MRDFLPLHTRLLQGDSNAAEELAEALLPWLLHSLLRKFSHTDEQTPLDRAFVALWKQGEWHTEPFAALLGFADQPLKSQVKLVKQTKDRIIKRLRRELATWPPSERAQLAAA